MTVCVRAFIVTRAHTAQTHAHSAWSRLGGRGGVALEVLDAGEHGLEGGAEAEEVALDEVGGQVGARAAPLAEDGVRGAADVHGAALDGLVARLGGGRHAHRLAACIDAALGASWRREES